MDDFLQEIEQDVRNEKIWQIWKKNQSLITWSAITILVLSAAWSMWTWHVNRQQTQWGESFVRAQMLLDQGKMEEGIRYLEALEHTGSSYAILSSFVKAHFYAQEGDHQNREKAIASYERIAQYKHVSAELKEFAQLCSLLTQMDMPQPNVEGLLAKVEPLCAEKSYWPLLAQEIKGGLMLMNGKQAEAREIFVNLAKNSNVPPSMRSRAQVLSRGGLSETAKN